MLTPTRPSSRVGRTRRTVLLALAVGQVVASAIVQIVGSDFQTPDRPGEPAVVPVGWAFSIWGPIIALGLGYAVWAWPQQRPDPDLRHRLALPLGVTFACFSLWLVAAQLEPVWSTLVVFVVLLAALISTLRIAVAAAATVAGWSRTGRVLLWGLLGGYTGWCSVAIWINLTTAFAGSGAPIDGPVGVLGQLAALVGATATAALLVRTTRGSGATVPLAAAALWGLVTSALGSVGAQQPVLAGVAGLGALALVLVTVATLRSAAGPLTRPGTR